MGNLDTGEILLIAGVAVLLFGAGRIADMGKGLGDALREADGDTARIAAIAFVVAVAIISWLAVSAAMHQ
jgi:TatA/E family protein of Tat protein translocase